MPLSPEDIASRAHGIGSSEIAAIADLDPHKGPTQVWLDKLGLLPRSENIAKWSGHKLEPVIAEMYAEHTGAVLTDGGGTQVHPVHSWARATRDRCANPGPAEIVEIKNVGAWALRFWWVEGRFQAPIDKVIQAQWQLAVCGGERVHLAALLGGTDFRIFEVVRDDEMIEALFEIAERFWVDHVLARVPPDDDPEQRREAMAALYPRSNGLLLPRSTEAEAIHARLLDVETREAAVEVDRAEAEAAALALLGDHDGVDGLFTWRTQRGRIDWKAAAQAAGVSEKDAERYRGKPYRVLRTKKPKEKSQ